MFSKKDIEGVFEHVHSPSDYPQLIRDLSDLGAMEYVFIVKNGVNIFYGPEAHTINMGVRYDELPVQDFPSEAKLHEAMKNHASGAIGFSEYCKALADAGVEKWVSDLRNMTVVYLDKRGRAIYVQNIPEEL